MKKELAKTDRGTAPVLKPEMDRLIDDIYASIKATRVAFAEIARRQDVLVTRLQLIQSRLQVPAKVSQDLYDQVQRIEGAVNKQTCMLRRRGHKDAPVVELPPGRDISEHIKSKTNPAK